MPADPLSERGFAHIHWAGGVAVIAGAARGLGPALAHGVAERGMHIVLADEDPAVLTRTATALTDRFPFRRHRFLALECDVANDADQDMIAAETFEMFGRVDLLVDNAHACDPQNPATSGFLRPFLPVLRSQGRGWIVLVEPPPGVADLLNQAMNPLGVRVSVVDGDTPALPGAPPAAPDEERVRHLLQSVEPTP